MIYKAIKKMLGLCDHEWRHASNFVTWSGPMEVEICTRRMPGAVRYFDGTVASLGGARAAKVRRRD